MTVEILLSEEQVKLLREQIHYLIETELEKISSLSTSDKQLLNKKETAIFLGISSNTLDSWILQGLPHHKVGKILRFDKKEITSWLRSR